MSEPLMTHSGDAYEATLEDDVERMEQRIAELEAQVTRLQDLMLDVVDYHLNLMEDDREALRGTADKWLTRTGFAGYKQGDLDKMSGDD